MKRGRNSDVITRDDHNDKRLKIKQIYTHTIYCGTLKNEDCLKNILSYCNNSDLFKWQFVCQKWTRICLNSIVYIEDYYLPAVSYLHKLNGLKTFKFGHLMNRLRLTFKESDMKMLPVGITKLVIGGGCGRGDIVNDKILSRLILLTNLKIFRCQNLDGSCFKQLTRLKTLVLNGCEKIKGDYITCLTKLQKLSSYNNTKIEDQHINKMTTISKLKLASNFSKKSLYSLTQLEKLSIYENPHIHYDALSKMDNLKYLQIEQDREDINDIKYAFNDKDMAQLVNLKHLNTLKISENDFISDIGIAQMTNITKLILRNNNDQITEKCMSSLHNLKTLIWEHFEFEDVSQIKLPLNLTKLVLKSYIGKDGIHYLTNLQKLTKLTSLNLSSIGYCIDLAGLTNITQLNISSALSLNVSNLIHLKKLQVFKIQHIHFPYPTQMQDLKYLYSYETNIGFRTISKIPNLDFLYIDGESIDLKYLSKIILKNNVQQYEDRPLYSEENVIYS